MDINCPVCEEGRLDGEPCPLCGTPDDNVLTTILPCPHRRVIVYSRCVSIQTWEEPAEYEFKVECKDCGEYIDVGEIPKGTEETEEDWEDYYEGDL